MCAMLHACLNNNGSLLMIDIVSNGNDNIVDIELNYKFQV